MFTTDYKIYMVVEKKLKRSRALSYELIQFAEQNYLEVLNVFHSWFQNLPISYFTYYQRDLKEVDDNFELENDSFFFSIDLDWMKLRLSQDWIGRKVVDPIRQALESDKIYPYMWPSDYKGDDIIEAFSNHGYREALTMYKRLGLKLHIFCFSISKSECMDNVYNFYLHELHHIWDFCRLFLGQFENNFGHVLLPRSKNKLITNLTIKHDKKIDSKIKQVKNNKIKIFKDGALMELTTRQWALMEQLSYGYSIKQIASHMNLSSRTIEANYNLLKKTLNLYAKDKILKVWRDNNIF